MNAFFLMGDGPIVTPPLGGTILPGITRNSIISLAARRGIRCARNFIASPSGAGMRSGRLREVFACGTTAVVTVIGTVENVDGGIVTESLGTDLTGIQRSTVDPANRVRRL
ncbi:Amino-transferase class IV [Sphingobium sp. AP50]|nr:aminotransferase class IV [Sphingobium sp. AP50]SEJ98643.1 Amino-transferase class IV [Sphingobium sp. AP50]